MVWLFMPKAANWVHAFSSLNKKSHFKLQKNRYTPVLLFLTKTGQANRKSKMITFALCPKIGLGCFVYPLRGCGLPD